MFSKCVQKLIRSRFNIHFKIILILYDYYDCVCVLSDLT